MLIRRSILHFRIITRDCQVWSLLFLIFLGARQFSMPTPIHAQADSSESRQRSAPRPSAPLAAGAPAVRALFGQHCVKCHGADGTGSPAHGLLSEIPDFTKGSWQAQRSDTQLIASILDGKGRRMPPVGGKISEEQVRGLLAYVRSFAPTTAKSGPRQQEEPGLASFDKHYHRLEQEMDDLRRQLLELSQATPGGAPSKPSEPGQHEVVLRSAPAEPGTPAVADLFRRRCMKCHGTDGTGNKARERLPEIPDFTNPSWQARRADSKLLSSVLDGKGEDMPAQRRKISEEQARGLVKYVRAFTATKGNSKEGKQEGPTQSKPATPDPPSASFEERQLSAPHPPSRKPVPPRLCKAPCQGSPLRRHLEPPTPETSSGGAA